MQPQPVPSNIVPLVQPELPRQFQPPTLDMCILQGAKLGLPEIECQKFFHFYESNGWRVGRNKMKLWHGAMAGWKLRWWERAIIANRNVEIILRTKELDRVESRMKLLKGNYPDHMDWDLRDRQEYKSLKTRREELIKILNLKC